MKSYTRTGNIDNVFEQEIYNLLREYCSEHAPIHFYVKLPLANLVTDKAYLEANPEIRRFVLHWNTHVDFTLFNAIDNPILAIELDGRHHNKVDQMQRDMKKNAALEHMEIPLWRLASKSAITKQEFFEKLASYLDIV